MLFCLIIQLNPSPQNETDLVVHSVVTDLVEAVHMMSLTSNNSENPLIASDDTNCFSEGDQVLDQTTYYDCDKELDPSAEELCSSLNSLSIDVSHNEVILRVY